MDSSMARSTLNLTTSIVKYRQKTRVRYKTKTGKVGLSGYCLKQWRSSVIASHTGIFMRWLRKAKISTHVNIYEACLIRRVRDQFYKDKRGDYEMDQRSQPISVNIIVLAYLIRCTRDQFNKIDSTVITQCIMRLKSPGLLWVVIRLLARQQA